MEISVKKNNLDAIINICNCMIESIAYKFEEDPPKVTMKQAITNFKIKYARECLFYITDIKYASDNPALKIEIEIAINTYILFILINKMDINSSEIEIEIDNQSQSPETIMIFLWLEISQLIETHKSVFKNNFPQESYFFSNLYIFDIADTIILLSKSLANKLSKDLNISLSSKSLLNLNMLENPKICEFIKKESYIHPLQKNIDALR